MPICFHRRLDDDLGELSRLAEESSLTTHASSQCRSACRYLAAILAALIRGDDRAVVLSAEWYILDQLRELEPLDPAINAVARGSFKQKSPPDIRGSGWVVESLEAALWAFDSSASFAEAVLKAVNLGDDADTTGAVCGQLGGACWGKSGIPDKLRSELADCNLIVTALDGLLHRAN